MKKIDYICIDFKQGVLHNCKYKKISYKANSVYSIV